MAKSVPRKDPAAQVDEAAEEAIRQIRKIQARFVEPDREEPAMVEAQTEARRGPKPGTGGRPMKGQSRRVSRTFTLDQSVLAWVETQRRDGESFSEAIERLLKGAMKT